jgi:hypothetical protein
MYRVPWRYHNIREGGVTMSDKDTATVGVHQEEFGLRQKQTANAFSYLFFVYF